MPSTHKLNKVNECIIISLRYRTIKILLLFLILKIICFRSLIFLSDSFYLIFINYQNICKNYYFLELLFNIISNNPTIEQVVMWG
jgi:hypothetical protein